SKSPFRRRKAPQTFSVPLRLLSPTIRFSSFPQRQCQVSAPRTACPSPPPRERASHSRNQIAWHSAFPAPHLNRQPPLTTRRTTVPLTLAWEFSFNEPFLGFCTAHAAARVFVLAAAINSFRNCQSGKSCGDSGRSSQALFEREG